MSRLLLVSLSSTLLLGGCDTAGPPDPPPLSEQIFGTEYYDAGLDLLQTSDGGLVVGGIGHGVPAPTDGTIPTPNLTRLDANGRVLWSRLYNGSRVSDDLQGSELLSVHPYGSGYAGLIRTGILTNDTDKLRLVTVGPNGRVVNSLYERPGITARSSQTLRRTQDGGFILAGATPYCKIKRLSVH